MAIDYDIDPVDKVVFIRIYGIIALDDIRAVIDDIRHDARFARKMSALVDARELRRAFFVRETDGLIKLFSDKKSRFIKNYAFIVANDLVSGVGRRFLVRARRSGLNMSVFGDYVSALKRLRNGNPRVRP